MAIAAAVIAFGSVAYTVAESKSSSLTNEHWNFVGSDDPQTPDNYLSADQYEPADENENCDGSETLCQVYAPASESNSDIPDFGAIVIAPDQTVQDRIQDALSNGPNETVTMEN